MANEFGKIVEYEDYSSFKKSPHSNHRRFSFLGTLRFHSVFACRSQKEGRLEWRVVFNLAQAKRAFEEQALIEENKHLKVEAELKKQLRKTKKELSLLANTENDNASVLEELREEFDTLQSENHSLNEKIESLISELERVRGNLRRAERLAEDYKERYRIAASNNSHLLELDKEVAQDPDDKPSRGLTTDYDGQLAKNNWPYRKNK